jgi:hypothetical protein
VTSLLSNRALSQDQLDIENMCMIIAAFQASGNLSQELQNLILGKVTQSLQSLSIEELAKLFATISRYASVEQQSGKESQ